MMGKESLTYYNVLFTVLCREIAKILGGIAPLHHFCFNFSGLGI